MGVLQDQGDREATNPAAEPGLPKDIHIDLNFGPAKRIYVWAGSRISPQRTRSAPPIQQPQREEMTDSLSDDERLRATEAQMRRALGLRNTSQTQAIPLPATPTASTSHPQRRRFVRDGEVPVSVIHRDQGDASGTNALEAARQALREQVAAREHAEHLLQEAQATIHDLQTKLAHERLARDEAVQRVDSEKQVVEQALQSVREELAAERDFRQKRRAGAR